MTSGNISSNTKFGVAVNLPNGPMQVTAMGDVNSNLVYLANNYDGTSSLVPQTRMWASGTVTAPTVQITGVPTMISSSGNSDDIDVSMVGVLLGTVVGGATTGSGPTLNFYLDAKDALGNYLPILSFTQLTGPSLTYATTGPGTANVYVLTKYVRLRWVLGGTGGPSFANCAVALAGR